MLFERQNFSLTGSVKTIGKTISDVGNTIGGAITSKASREIRELGEGAVEFVDKEAAARARAGNLDTTGKSGALSFISVAALTFAIVFVLRAVRVRV